MNSFEDCRKKRRGSFEKAALFSSCSSIQYYMRRIIVHSCLLTKVFLPQCASYDMFGSVLLCYILVNLCTVYPVCLFGPCCAVVSWLTGVSRASVLFVLLCYTLVSLCIPCFGFVRSALFCMENLCIPCFCFFRASLLNLGEIVYPVLWFCPYYSVIPW
jgi:hypothetical protein